MVVGNRSGFCRYLLSKPKYQPTTDTLIIRTSLKFVISPDFGGNLSFPEMSYTLPYVLNGPIYLFLLGI
jgi:hypothetical protein